MALKECSSHSTLMLDALVSLKDRNHFCDVTIIAGDEKIKVHRLVLVAASRYFEELFLSDGTEATTGILEFPDTPVGIVKQCIEFIYSGKTEFSAINIKEFLEFSDRICLYDLSDLYVKFLSRNVNSENIVEVISVAHLYKNQRHNLAVPIQHFVWYNSKEFVESKKYVTLEQDCLEYVLPLLSVFTDSVKLCNVCEETKMNMIMNWIKHDLEKRQGQFYVLFRYVNMSFLSKDFIKERLLSESFVSSSNECLRRISDFLLNGNNSQKRNSDSSEPRTSAIIKRHRYQNPKNLTHIVTCNVNTGLVYRGDLKNSSQWSRVTALPSMYTRHLDITEHRDSIYIGNGYQFRCFDGEEWKALWESDSLSDMLSSTQYNRCVGIGNYVCMVALTHVVIYDLTSETVTEINRYLSHHGKFFFVAPCSKQMFIMGGNDTGKAVTVFAIEAKSSERVSPMNCARIAGSGVVYQNDVYAIGGGPKSVELYNTITRQWIILRNLEVESRGCKIHIDDKLYIFGGKLQDKVQTVELEKLHVSDEEKKPTRNNVEFDVFCGSFS